MAYSYIPTRFRSFTHFRGGVIINGPVVEGAFLLVILLLGSDVSFSAVLSGRVEFAGTPPSPRTVDTSSDPACAKANGGRPLKTQDFEVNQDGTLKDVFVFIKSGAKLPAVVWRIFHFGGTQSDGVPLPSPRAWHIRVNQPLLLKNGDPTFHNVREVAEGFKQENPKGLPVRPPKNPEFNVGIPNAAPPVEKRFSQPEQMVKLKCDVHGWMSAYIGVMDTPYFAVTWDDHGRFSIKRPPSR